MKTIDITNIHKLLNSAKLTKMEDSDKIKVIKIVRSIRPIATDYEEFVKQVYNQFKAEDHEAMTERAENWNKSHQGMKVSDLSQQELEELKTINSYFGEYDKRVENSLKKEAENEVTLTIEMLSEDAFCKLVSSNDWTCEQIMLISDNLVAEKSM